MRKISPEVKSILNKWKEINGYSPELWEVLSAYTFGNIEWLTDDEEDILASLVE